MALNKRASSIALISKVAELWFAEITTVVGTVASLVSLLLSVTVNDCERSVLLRVTVAVVAAAPASSAKVAAAMTRFSVS